MPSRSGTLPLTLTLKKVDRSYWLRNQGIRIDYLTHLSEMRVLIYRMCVRINGASSDVGTDRVVPQILEEQKDGDEYV